MQSLTNQEPLTALEYEEIVRAAGELCRRVEDARTLKVILQAKLEELRRIHQKQMEDMSDTVGNLANKITHLEARNSDLERTYIV